MKRVAIFLSLVLGASCGDEVINSDQQDLDSQSAGRPEPGAAGITWARGEAPTGQAGHTSSPNLSWHGGPVQHGTTAVRAVFWGASWTSGDNKIAEMDSFYSGVGSSTYAATNTEYDDGNGNVSTTVGYAGHTIDNSVVPRNPGAKVSTIVNEVCGQLGSSVVAGGYYPVYVDSGRNHAGYCAWHSYGTCPNGTSIQVGFFFNLDNDAGCDPQDTTTGHSQGVAALGNVSGHEFSEMVTDPRLNAWYDSGGAENADKCAWAFGSSSVKIGRESWKIQGNWSNRAYDAGTGYPNRSGQLGCLDGGNYR
jgi:hypothetical protein